MASRALSLVAVAFVLLLAGCNGGTVDRHALTNDSSTIDSIACEGALLAQAISRGRVTSAFAGVQAGALRLQASNLADALSRRPTGASLEQRVRARARDAASLAATLMRLHDHPSDRGLAAAAARSLRHLGGCP
jgi:hypothetical protein